MNVEDTVAAKVDELRGAGFTDDEIYVKVHRALERAFRRKPYQPPVSRGPVSIDEFRRNLDAVAKRVNTGAVVRPTMLRPSNCGKSCPVCGNPCVCGPRHKRHYCCDDDGTVMHFWKRTVMQ